MFGGYVVIPVLGMLAAALLIGFPYEDQFWLNATLGVVSIVLQIVGWSALIRRALGYRQWKIECGMTKRPRNEHVQRGRLCLENSKRFLAVEG